MPSLNVRYLSATRSSATAQWRNGLFGSDAICKLAQYSTSVDQSTRETLTFFYLKCGGTVCYRTEVKARCNQHTTPTHPKFLRT